jgi:hypothetical protein
MKVLDKKVSEAIDKGLATQVVLADSEGFLLDNLGYVFDPDELVALFLSNQWQLQDGAIRFDFGRVNEFSFTMVGPEQTVACRRVFDVGAGCLVIVVSPNGAPFNLIVSNAIRAYSKYWEKQQDTFRTA